MPKLVDIIKKYNINLEGVEVPEDVKINLEKYKDLGWNGEEDYESRKIYYVLPETDLFLEINYCRAGDYHSEYFYTDPVCSLVKLEKTEKTIYQKITEISESTIEDLKGKYFDKYDETTLKPIYESGWKKEGKTGYFESVFNVDGVLLKQTLIGDQDYTVLVDYAIVELKEVKTEKFVKVKK